MSEVSAIQLPERGLGSKDGTEALDRRRTQATIKGDLHCEMREFPEVVAFLNASLLPRKLCKFNSMPLRSQGSNVSAVRTTLLEDLQ